MTRHGAFGRRAAGAVPWSRRWRGELLADAMLRRGLSEFDLAAALGVDPRLIEEYVADRRTPNGWRVVALFAALGFDPEFGAAILNEPSIPGALPAREGESPCR
jgi:transcriptional regulator with XRE-family HTH domain